MARQVTEFSPNQVTGLWFQFKNTDNDVDYIKCVGTISGNSKTKTLRKKCGRSEQEMTVPTGMTVDLSAKFPIETVQSIYGFTKEGLKKGISGFGTKSTGSKMVIVARVLDTFEGIEKMMAFPVVYTNSGFSFAIDNENEEVANMSVTFDAGEDENQMYYYEAVIGDGTGDTIIETDAKKWETGFTTTLVK